MRLHHRMRCVAQQALGILLGAHGRLYQDVEGLLRALGWFLGGSWEALGKLVEASKRRLGPKTVMATIFRRFFKRIGNFGEPSWRRFNVRNRIFWGSKRVAKTKLILKAFWHRIWDDF